jgi:hypothetical protein
VREHPRAWRKYEREWGHKRLLEPQTGASRAVAALCGPELAFARTSGTMGGNRNPWISIEIPGAATMQWPTQQTSKPVRCMSRHLVGAASWWTGFVRRAGRRVGLGSPQWVRANEGR